MATQNVRYLLLRAYRDANVVGDDDDLSSLQQSEGLDSLNELLADLGSEGIYIPYEDSIDFNLVANQEDYVIDMVTPGATLTHQPIVKLNYVNITLGNATIPIDIITSGTYYGNNRIVTGQSIPQVVLLTKSLNSSKLSFYYKPSQNYPCNVIAQFQMGDVAGTDLLTTIPIIYRRFLRFALAREFSGIYQGLDMPQTYLSEYDRLFEKIKSNSRPTMESKRNPFFQGSSWNQDIRNGGYD